LAGVAIDVWEGEGVGVEWTTLLRCKTSNAQQKPPHRKEGDVEIREEQME